jgi:hypothetical protein
VGPVTPDTADDPPSLTFLSHLQHVLYALIVAQAVLYAVLTSLSVRFDYHSALEQRPILAVVSLLVGAFGLHLVSLKVALQLRSSRRLAKQIVLAAAVFRIILLPSLPIQEVDIYRYLWDGAVTASGISPFQYSPQQVRDAASGEDLSQDMSTLTALRDGSDSLDETLHRIHFGALTTVYPPVSQAVFGVAAALTPDDASILNRILILKIVIVGFDLATLWLVISLLHRTRRHIGWSIVYGWCPLLLKEFANSGHLDSIAVFLTVAAISIWIIVLQRDTPTRLLWLPLSGGLLGLAVGAKLYPIVLLPLMVFVAARRVGKSKAAVLAFCCIATVGLMMAPMLSLPFSSAANSPLVGNVSQDGPPVPDADSGQTPPPSHPKSGLAVFLGQWEMNDLLFMVLVENLRPDVAAAADESTQTSHWFVVIPQSLRQSISTELADWLQMSRGRATFAAARSLTLALFGCICLAIAWQSSQSSDATVWLNAVFVTLVWFWALSPTLNPWYWTWALPFLPFVCRKAWFSVSLLLLVYYLRFWLLYQVDQAAVLGTQYRGESFFHFILVPLEHGIWMGWLLYEWRTGRRM